jgi:hypothetical protein
MTHYFTGFSRSSCSNFISSLFLFSLLFGATAPAAQESRKRNREDEPIARPLKQVKLAHNYNPEQTQALSVLLAEIREKRCCVIAGEDTSRILDFIRAGASPYQRVDLIFTGPYAEHCVQSMESKSLLEYYVEANNYQAVSCLLEHGVNPSFISPQDPRGDRPLDFAQCPNMVRLLLDKGANPHLRNSRGATVLHKAAFKGRSPQVLDALCQTGLDVNLVDRAGDSALHDLFFLSDEDEGQETIKSAEVLCWYGGDLDRENRHGQKPLDLWEDRESIQHDPAFALTVRARVREIPAKKEKARKELVAQVTPYLDGVAVLGDLTAEYSGAPGITLPDVDAWD